MRKNKPQLKPKPPILQPQNVSLPPEKGNPALVEAGEWLVLAFAIPAKPDDKTILYQGERYVVAEVAGPTVLPLGEVGKASESAIRKNVFEEILSF